MEKARVREVEAEGMRAAAAAAGHSGGGDGLAGRAAALAGFAAEKESATKRMLEEREAAARDAAVEAVALDAGKRRDAMDASMGAVRRCKLDPILKAPGFKGST